jgi:ubiquitin-like-conjugating enzyme ATG10
MDRNAFDAACIEFCQASRALGDEWKMIQAKDANGSLVEYLELREFLEKETKLIHVVYSPSYNVPVLYLNSYTAGMTSTLRLMSVDGELIEWLGEPGVLSQQDHPIVGIPFYFIHPCRTQELLREISGDCNYIAGWLSLVGPQVGLHLKAAYGLPTKSKSNPVTTTPRIVNG